MQAALEARGAGAWQTCEAQAACRANDPRRCAADRGHCQQAADGGASGPSGPAKAPPHPHQHGERVRQGRPRARACAPARRPPARLAAGGRARRPPARAPARQHRHCPAAALVAPHLRCPSGCRRRVSPGAGRRSASAAPSARRHRCRGQGAASTSLKTSLTGSLGAPKGSIAGAATVRASCSPVAWRPLRCVWFKPCRRQSARRGATVACHRAATSADCCGARDAASRRAGQAREARLSPMWTPRPWRLALALMRQRRRCIGATPSSTRRHTTSTTWRSRRWRATCTAAGQWVLAGMSGLEVSERARLRQWQTGRKCHGCPTPPGARAARPRLRGAALTAYPAWAPDRARARRARAGHQHGAHVQPDPDRAGLPQAHLAQAPDRARAGGLRHPAQQAAARDRVPAQGEGRHRVHDHRLQPAPGPGRCAPLHGRRGLGCERQPLLPAAAVGRGRRALSGACRRPAPPGRTRSWLLVCRSLLEVERSV